MVLRRLTDPPGSFCSENISTVPENGAFVTGAMKTPPTLGTTRSFFGRPPVAGCWPWQVKTVNAARRQTEAIAIRPFRTQTSLGGEISRALPAVQEFHRERVETTP